MMAEIIRAKDIVARKESSLEFKESKLTSFSKESSLETSFRVYQDGKVGIYYHIGPMEDEEGYAKAAANLVRERPYPFTLETGQRARDKREKVLTDAELRSVAESCMKYLTDNYPNFRFEMKIKGTEQDRRTTNDLGMDYRHQDYAVDVDIVFKHVDSKNINDGYFQFSLRTFDEKIFRGMADLYLSNYEKEVEIPEELILDVQYYGIVGRVGSYLNGEELARGTSLLTGKIGEQVFSEDFTLEHDATDDESWFNTFWDGDGHVFENDKFLLVEKGVPKTGYADKKTAKQYGIPYTGPAYHSFTDIPGPGGLNLRIKRSDKTIKELLNGRYAILPLDWTSSGFNEKGDYTMVISKSLLYDGDGVVGRLPEFKVSTNIFDMFGKDFIGVGSDNPITYNDKQRLYRVNRV